MARATCSKQHDHSNARARARAQVPSFVQIDMHILSGPAPAVLAALEAPGCALELKSRAPLLVDERHALICQPASSARKNQGVQKKNRGVAGRQAGALEVCREE